MRICYLSHVSAHFTAPYVKFFHDAGHDVHLVSCEHGDVPGATVHHPTPRSVDPMSTSLAYFWHARAVGRAIRAIQPDILHAHYVTSNGWMAVRSGCHPLVITAHGSDVIHSMTKRLRRAMIRYVMRSADLVNPVSNDLADRIAQLGVDRRKILPLSQGVETERFRLPRDKTSPVTRILCTRKIAPVYDCGAIVESLRLLRERGARFICRFAASGPDESKLKERVKAAGLEEQVTFSGGYTQNELPELLRTHDIYVSASRWDGTSLSLLEAMASGIFPVVSDIPANRAWLNGDGDAEFFAVGDARQLADGLERVIKNPAQRAAAAESLCQRVLAEGDRTTNMGRLGEAYERLVSQRYRRK